MSTDRQPVPAETTGKSSSLPEESMALTERADDPVALPQQSHPIFYDERRRRWPWFLRGAITGLALIIAGTVMLVIGLIALPLMP